MIPVFMIKIFIYLNSNSFPEESVEIAFLSKKTVLKNQANKFHDAFKEFSSETVIKDQWFICFVFIKIFSSLTKLIGNRGNRSQSTMHGVHQKTGIMFFAEINKNAVSCWNTKIPLSPPNIGQIAQDDVNLIYPSDLNVSFLGGRKLTFSGMRKPEGRAS